MKKFKAFFYVSAKSLTSLEYYKEVVQTRGSFSFKYFTTLAVLAALVTSTALAIPTSTDIKAGVNEFIAVSLKAYPDDLVVTAKDGELSINQPEPYIIALPEPEKFEDAKDGVLKNAVVFDSNGTLNDLDTYSTFVLINKSNILVRSNNKIEVYPIKDVPDGKFTKATIEKTVGVIDPFKAYIPLMVFGMLLFGTFFYFFGLRLVYLLIIISPLLWIIGRVRKQSLPYSKYFQIGVHTMTLPLVIEIITTSANVDVPLPLWFFVTNVVFGLFVVFKVGESKLGKDSAPASSE